MVLTSACELQRDTLQRHVAIHDGEARRRQTRSAPRVKCACRNCSRSKLRCDGQLPCQRCQARHVACRYGPPTGRGSRTQPPPSYQDTGIRRDAQQSEANENTQILEQESERAPSLASTEHSYSTTQIAPLENGYDNANIVQPSLVDATTTTALQYQSIPSMVGGGGSPAGGFASAPDLHIAQQLGAYPGADVSQMRLANEQDFANTFELPRFDPIYNNSDDFRYFPECQSLVPFLQGPYINMELPITGYQDKTGPMETQLTPSELSIDQELPEADSEEAPVLSFLGARSSPEPQVGQKLRFNELMQRTREKQGNDGDEHRGIGSSKSKNGNISHTSIIGVFSPLLSPSSGNSSLWESENFGHVPPLHLATYDRLLKAFEQCNVDNGHYTKFAAGEFPSILALNTFLQLYFEEFHPLFPFLHLPTFDSKKEHWLLVLAVVVTGCRFSRVSAAVECESLLQEFLRRSFHTLVRRNYLMTVFLQINIACRLSWIIVRHVNRG